MSKRGLWRGQYILFGIIIVLIFTLFQYDSSITGNVVYENILITKIWNFSNTSEYSYNDSVIEIATGEAKLRLINTTITTNTTTTQNYTLLHALYDPEDKTNKLNSRDNERLEKSRNKTLDVIFSQDLTAGDTINLYIKEGTAGTLFFCPAGTPCSTTNYGAMEYNDSEGWFTATLTTTPIPKNILNLYGTKVKIDFINSSSSTITTALYNPSDKTTKVLAKDNERQEIDAKLFSVITSPFLTNNDVISLYLKGEEQVTIYLCSYGNRCTSQNYGTTNFNGTEGWYNLTIADLPTPTTHFTLNPNNEEIKIDAITFTHQETVFQNTTTISYPSNAEIKTMTITPTNFLRWNLFTINKTDNQQNVTAYYSTTNGVTWIEVPANNSVAHLNSSSLQFKITLNSNQTITPTVNSLSVSYLYQQCLENWTTYYGECFANDSKKKYYLDQNDCGTSINLPADNGTEVSCDYCTPNWTEVNTSCRRDNVIITSYKDLNSCYTVTNLSSDNNPPQKVFHQCDYCSIHNCSAAINISKNAFQKIAETENMTTWRVNASNEARTSLEITSPTNQNSNETESISIVHYDWNIVNKTSENIALNQYIDIEVNMTNMSSIKIVMYYTDEEITQNNISEESIQIQYYNETAEQWISLNSSVNMTENCVYAFIDHFSIYGLFGEQNTVAQETSSTTSSSTGSASSGGRGSSSTKATDHPSLKETENQESIIAAESARTSTTTSEIATVQTQTCSYVIEVNLPNELSLETTTEYQAEITNTGNCAIQYLSLALSGEVNKSIEITPETTKSLLPGEKTTFVLVRTQKKTTESPFSFLTGSAITPLTKTETKEGIIQLQAYTAESSTFKRELPIKIIIKESITIPKISLIGGGMLLTIFIIGIMAFAWHQRENKHEKENKKR
ncbi:TPA: hypothetical protein HA241_01125 [Candidatus Woesearchaeota archaeon]|nr:hypothetical protein [Candidatus Woesearchaeota archaeon]